jgi:Right handed beta helix region
MFPRKVLFALLPAILVVSGTRASAQAYVNENQSAYIYVDANYGNDSNSGASGYPLRTIQQAVDRANANNEKWVGTKVIVRPGVYREYVNIGNYRSTTAPVIIQAENPGTAIISGSDVLWNWSWSWGSVYTHPWTPNLGTCAVPAGWPSPIAPVGRRTEMLVVNGTPLTEVMATSELRPGTFFVDEGKNLIYMDPPAGTNVSTSTIEAATRRQTLSVQSRSNVVIRGMVFRHAASCINTTAVSVSSSWNIFFDTDQATWNNWGGIGIFSSNNVTVQWSIASHNGGEGFTIGHGQSVLFNHNESDYNNWRGVQAGLYDWGMGGAKFMYMRNTTVENFFAYRNQAQGLWFDTDNQDITVNNATLSENVLGSLQVELNEGPILVEYSHLCSSGIGINVINTEYLTLNHNTFYNNGGTDTQEAEIFIAGKSGGRAVTDYLTGQYHNIYTSHVNLTNNTFEDAGWGQNVFGTYLSGFDWTQFATTVYATNNAWYDPHSIWNFKLPNSKYVDLGGWKSAMGTDWSSWWGTPSTSPAGACSVPWPSFTDFAVNLNDQAIWMYNGGASTGVHVNSFGYGTVYMWVTGMPSDTWAWLDQGSMVSGATTLHFGASTSAAYQTVPVTLWAVSGSRVHSITVYVHVTPS